MGSIFSPKSPPPPPPAPEVPTPEDPEIQQRKEDVRLAALKRRGRASTILTSGAGDPSAPNLSRPTLGA